MSKNETPLSISADEAREISDALADTLCWFTGFRSARPKAEMPPGIQVLRDFNIRLKRSF